MRVFAAFFACAALVARVAAQPVSNGGNYELPLRTLVLTTQSVLSDYPRWVMNAMQQPFDLYQLVDDDATVPNEKAGQIASLLKDGDNPKYNSIVLETFQLGYQTEDNTFVSALTPDAWKAISDYCQQYQVRKVVLASSPNVDRDNIVPYPGWEQGSSADATVQMLDNDVAKAVANNVKLDAVWKLGQVTEFTRTSYWYYPATLSPSHNGSIQPFMSLNPYIEKPDDCPKNVTLGNGDVVDACTYEAPNWIAGFLRTKGTGEEEMHFLVNSNLFDHHSFSFADIWFTWVTKGIWPGMRRVPLSTQIDDVFLSTGTYNTTLNRQAISPLEPTFRTTVEDISLLKKWQDDFNANLPEGSRFVIEFAYNGLGYFAFAGKDGQDLDKAFPQYRDDFFWVSHTWSHMDLYCPNSNCEEFGFTKYNDSLFELQKNHWFAYNYLFKDISDEQLSSSEWPTWSENSLVTPRISGLNLSDSIRSMRDAGIDVAVGDNSRQDLKPTNPWHPFQTRVDDGTPEKRTVNVIPRFATRVYFDCATAEQNAMEHNSIYGPDCVGADSDAPAVLPNKCNRTTFKYPRNLTMEEILTIEGFEVARNLLSYRTDPYMFHQANLNFHETEKGTKSLLTWWIEIVMENFQRYNSLPIFTLKMADMETWYVERMTRDNCNIEASIQYVNGKPENLIMRGDGCTAKLSTTRGNTIEFADQYEYEQYGPDRTRDVVLTAGNETVIPLGKPKVAPTKKPSLPYPPVPKAASDAAAEADFERELSKYDEWESGFITQLSELEEKLHKDLRNDLDKFVPQYTKYAKDADCQSAETNQYALNVYDQFDVVGMPTDEAIQKDKMSWYRHMEDSLIALGAQAVKQGGAWANKTEIEEIKADVSQHLVSTQDRLENYGTVVNIDAYDQMEAASKVLRAKPACGSEPAGTEPATATSA